MAKLVVTIDGPSGSGKSTVARMLSEKLGYLHLDTGAMYRAVALAAENSGIPFDDAPSLDRMCGDIQIELKEDSRGMRVFLDGEDVTDRIRLPEMSMGSSAVSAVAQVRSHMVRLQRKIGRFGGIVAEGRDMGTVVFPDSKAKFFLDAPPEVRARRRWQELNDRGHHGDDFSTVMEEMAQRDKADSSRGISPLRKADDAILVDTSGKTAREVADILYKHVIELETPSG